MTVNIIARIRTDKPAAEADTIRTLRALAMEKPPK